MVLLEARNLTKAFDGVHAVQRASLTVVAHTITALIGPNGAGKTTLFNMINGFIVPDNGTVHFNGQDITSTAAWQRSRLGMSRTFQLSRLFRNLTLGDNLKLAVRQDDDKLWRALSSSGDAPAVLELIQRVLLQVGLHKDLATPVTDLSYGEQKLFDLSRALVNPHTMLLLDEPVAGVNPVLRERLKQILRELKTQGETILLIEHDIDFVRAVADWVIVMDQGTVLMQGEPDEVLRDARVLNAYLGVLHVN